MTDPRAQSKHERSELNLEVGRMYPQLIGMISAEVAQTGGKKWSAYVHRALCYGLHDLLPKRTQMFRTMTEVQVTEICLGFGKRRKHPERGVH